MRRRKVDPRRAEESAAAMIVVTRGAERVVAKEEGMAAGKDGKDVAAIVEKVVGMAGAMIAGKAGVMIAGKDVAMIAEARGAALTSGREVAGVRVVGVRTIEEGAVSARRCHLRKGLPPR